MMDGSTKIYGVIGWPVGHTASPALHNAAFESLGMNARYAAFAVPPDALADAVRGMRGLGIAGLNVTVPHKRYIIPFLDELHDEAAELRSVNTVARGEDGRLHGYNTDARGFLNAMCEEGAALEGARAIVIGAGGATPAVLHALRTGGAAEALIFNRTRSKADALAGEFDCSGFVVSSADFSSAEIDTVFEKANIIINASSAGMDEDYMPPFDTRLIASRHFVVDIIYKPWETRLLSLARQRGARTANGYGMLLHQAALAFGIWTGAAAPLETMRSAGRAFIDARDARK